jgi:hypothetical protein
MAVSPWFGEVTPAYLLCSCLNWHCISRHTFVPLTSQVDRIMPRDGSHPGSHPCLIPVIFRVGFRIPEIQMRPAELRL